MPNIFIVLLVLSGIIFGIKTSLIWQAIVLLVFVIYMSTERLRGSGLEGLVPLIIGLIFFAFVVVGDIYCVLAYGAGADIGNAVKWLFTP